MATVKVSASDIDATHRELNRRYGASGKPLTTKRGVTYRYEDKSQPAGRPDGTLVSKDGGGTISPASEAGNFRTNQRGYADLTGYIVGYSAEGHSKAG